MGLLVGLDRLTRQPAHAWDLDALGHAPGPNDCLVTSLIARFGLRRRCSHCRLGSQLGLGLPELSFEPSDPSAGGCLAALLLLDLAKALRCLVSPLRCLLD